MEKIVWFPIIRKMVCFLFHREHWEETGWNLPEWTDMTCSKCGGWWYINHSGNDRVMFPKWNFWW